MPPPTHSPRRRKEPPHPSPPPQPLNRVPPPPPQKESKDNNTDQDYISSNFRRIMYDSLKVLLMGFSLGYVQNIIFMQAQNETDFNYRGKRKNNLLSLEQCSLLFKVSPMKWRYFWRLFVLVCENYYTSTNPLMWVMITVTVTVTFGGMQSRCVSFKYICLVKHLLSCTILFTYIYFSTEIQCYCYVIFQWMRLFNNLVYD